MVVNIQKIIVEELVKAKSDDDIKAYVYAFERGVHSAAKAVETEFVQRPKFKIQVTKLGDDEHTHKITIEKVGE
jgi:hypothetical protein